MLDSTLLGVAQHTTGRLADWSVGVGVVMIGCNLFAIAVGRFAIQNAGEAGLSLPGKVPALWKRFGLPELLATVSLGHVLGAGVILGLTNAGML
ncbi:Photosystem I reaction center subunit PsaK [Neosynechococcus sphagnicola sy1]|uniref:Photosystem I reaction center subunit PsaK n=1 Tax=Neosynechococcus sphagnicola sy1 TaxID=1497020 RepID=A0A098TSE0_9CYAN|nr:photosystem I reaction center subunit PsaK [Neosynechococcus sphagnicola]KGF73683.1 Photosystem I reaction center subunit PsaK [Neosynechococcus sphagnicola sy1]